MTELIWHVSAITVPLMLAIAGAVVVARLIERRSIYSARIHSGRAAAETDKQAPPAQFAGLVSPEFDVISAATPHTEVLREIFLPAAARRISPPRARAASRSRPARRLGTGVSARHAAEAIYSFKHALVQDAAHGSLLRSSRQQLHAQIAEALETHFPEIVDS